MGKEVKLILVSAENNNKYYNMSENADSTFTATYGRVEKTAQTTNYAMYEWDKVYRSKVKKGYTDVTELYVEESKKDSKSTMGEIQNRIVKRLMDELQAFASNSIKENYSVSSNKVTQAMVDRAQLVINELRNMLTIGAKKDTLNAKLIELYQVIPRQMSKVQYHLFQNDMHYQKDLDEAGAKMKDEQDTLDVMAGQVIINVSSDDDDGEPVENILQLMKLEVEEVDAADIDIIKKLMGPSKDRFKKAFRANNIETRKKFERYSASDSNKQIELFWHGSRNQNWLNIMKTGLLIRPSGAIHTGSMFGDGIYFADKAQKSIGYSSLSGSRWTNGSSNKGFLALYEVNVGKQKKIKHHTSSCYSLSESILKKEGYDSVFAQGGADLVNNEYIVYRSERCTIKYLVELG